MPQRLEGEGGITEYGTNKRYINPLKWTCKEGKPIDALVGFTFWREWTYDENGELLQLKSRPVRTRVRSNTSSPGRAVRPVRE